MIGDVQHGWLALDKPKGLSSAKAVAAVKRLPGVKKIGHAGTLDPLASGVLPLALGEATKTVRFTMQGVKEYEFVVCWGKQTSTDDAEGEVIATSERIPTTRQIEKALPMFVGDIEQVPPVFSAIKVGGKRAYDLARKGQAAKLAPRVVHIYDFQLLHHENDSAAFFVRCGKGTYVRSLARDLAIELGTCAYVTDLRRTKVGPFDINHTILLESLKNKVYNAPLSEFVLPVEHVLDDIPVLCFTSEEARVFKQGQHVAKQHNLADDQLVCVKSNDTLVAIAQINGQLIKPVRIFNL